MTKNIVLGETSLFDYCCFKRIEMKTEFVVKEMYSGNYYCGVIFGWHKDIKFADRFEDYADAVRFIERESKGMYQIEKVYLVW